VDANQHPKFVELSGRGSLGSVLSLLVVGTEDNAADKLARAASSTTSDVILNGGDGKNRTGKYHGN
jgi:hypothetical protein